MDEPAATVMFLNLFNPVWNDREQLQDVKNRLSRTVFEPNVTIQPKVRPLEWVVSSGHGLFQILRLRRNGDGRHPETDTFEEYQATTRRRFLSGYWEI